MTTYRTNYSNPHKYVIALLFGLLILFTSSCATNDGHFLVDSGRNAEVIEVIDGDTIKVRINGNTETVRFLLMDTPEMNTKDEKKNPQPFAMEATEFVKKHLKNQEVTIVVGTEERDTYNRLLAYVYIDDETIQEKLLREGLARTAYLLNDVRLLEPFHEAQKKAVKQKKGIWSIPGYATPDTNRGFNWNEDE